MASLDSYRVHRQSAPNRERTGRNIPDATVIPGALPAIYPPPQKPRADVLYSLDLLLRGSYPLAFNSSAGHCATAPLTVPGGESPTAVPSRAIGTNTRN